MDKNKNYLEWKKVDILVNWHWSRKNHVQQLFMLQLMKLNWHVSFCLKKISNFTKSKLIFKISKIFQFSKFFSTVLDVGAFERLLGPCMNIMKRNFNHYEDQLVKLFGSKSNVTDLRWTFILFYWIFNFEKIFEFLIIILSNFDYYRLSIIINYHHHHHRRHP